MPGGVFLFIRYFSLTLFVSTPTVPGKEKDYYINKWVLEMRLFFDEDVTQREISFITFISHFLRNEHSYIS